MGLWVNPTLTSNRKKNDKLIEFYQKAFESYGLKNQIGFYCTKENLDNITWDNFKDDWYWWNVKHLDSIDNIHDLPTPRFFAYDNPDDVLVKPDYEGAANLSSASTSSGGASGGTDQGPIDYGGRSNCYTYMGWQCITAVSSSQYKLRASAGMNFDSEGFGVINGRYVIATTSYFGGVGDYVDFVTEQGHVLHCVIGDEKSSGDSNYSKIGHTYGNSVSVVEFVVDKRSWYGGHANPGTPSCHPEWAGNLKSWSKCGGYWN